MKDRRIGVFGGTFDPPHVGHARVAADVADALDLDRVLWVPARMSPFKQDEDVTPAEVRVEMVRRAVRTDRRFAVDDRELRRPSPSYTVDTLRELKAEWPDTHLYLILGADQLAELHRWKDPAGMAALARLAVMDRGGIDADEVAREAVERIPSLDGRLVPVPVRRVDVSSTELRASARAGHDIGARVPPGVEGIVRERGLYRS